MSIRTDTAAKVARDLRAALARCERIPMVDPGNFAISYILTTLDIAIRERLDSTDHERVERAAGALDAYHLVKRELL